MTSIRRVQTERLLQDVVHTLYSDGQKPLFAEVSTRMSKYFSEYPAGEPLPFPHNDAIASGKSDVDEYNRLLSFLAINLDVLYEASLRQVEDILDLTDSLQTHLNRLKKHRKRIDSQIEDYLLSLYNTDGYFFSVSDNFSDVTFTDLNMTSAQIDTEAGFVIMPTISNTSSHLGADQVFNPRISVLTESGITQFDQLASFRGALEDSLDNIIWAIEVRTAQPEEVVCTVQLSLGNSQDPVEISQINLVPYGATPVQAFFETREGTRVIDGDTSWVGFGNKIQTGTTKMIFGSDGTSASELRMTLRKTQPDYTEVINGKTFYKYIIGARSISITNKVFDPFARFVSKPMYLPDDLYGDLLIDAVSLDVVDDVPSGSDISYYIAASRGEAEEEFDSLDWHSILPINSNESGRKIVRFDGAAKRVRRISENPAGGDLQQIPLSSTGPTADRNPSPLIIPGVDVYRIAEFEEDVLLNSLELTEGVNTTKIFSRPIDPFAPFQDINLGYWANVFEDADDLTVDYGRIDAGDEFFYGGDVGAIGKDVFVETFLDADKTYPTFLEEFQKMDVRSLTWDVKVYLNGRPIGSIPPGVQKVQLPWSFMRGLNHVVLLIRIPSDAVENDIFLGSLGLMGRSNLYDYGNVRLDKWNYIDFFNMQYNEVGQPRTFTIRDGEIISRRKPTANFELRYAKSTGKGPDAVRLRAEMTRDRNSPHVTPIIESYRLRFSYAEESD